MRRGERCGLAKKNLPDAFFDFFWIFLHLYGVWPSSSRHSKSWTRFAICLCSLLSSESSLIIERTFRLVYENTVQAFTYDLNFHVLISTPTPTQTVRWRGHVSGRKFPKLLRTSNFLQLPEQKQNFGTEKQMFYIQGPVSAFYTNCYIPLSTVR